MSALRSLISRFVNYNDNNSLASRLRRKRINMLIPLIESAYKQHGYVNLINIGGTEPYWNIVESRILKDNNVQITIVNFFKGHKPVNHGSFNFVEADGCLLTNFPDNQFHIAHSNSVIEHVGNWNRIVSFSNELKRVSQKYYVQTPNYWFPIEPHYMTPFFHWLPKPTQLLILSKFQLGYFKKATSINEAMQIIEHANLIDKKMLMSLFPEAEIRTEWFFFFPKSLIALKK